VNDKLKKCKESANDQPEQYKMENIQNPEVLGKKHLLSIPINATPVQILNLWVKLQCINEKGDPYWKSEHGLNHFVNQNFEGFEGVDEIKEFNTNMNKTELEQAAWTFFNRYGKNKTKRRYTNLLIKHFTKFKDDKNVYSNIKDQCREHLKEFFQ
jgi:hypothetical protein